MIIKKYLFLLFIVLIASCQGEDTKGKIVIEYDNDWSAVITRNYTETNISGNGRQEFIYDNPDYLQINATKEDTSLEKLTVYIYEDDRIVAADSTRDPEKAVTAYYEYSY